MAGWKLTVRHGSAVSRERYEDLGEALSELRRRAEEIRAEGPLERTSALRDFEPGAQVAARLEISGKGLLRPPTAGVDVKGDGAIVPFAGGIRREELAGGGEDPFAAIRAALEDRR